MKRIYEQIILDHFKKNRQMLFLMGPRQVGKTTLSLMIERQGDGSQYFNWDDDDDREQILKGARHIGKVCSLEKSRQVKPLLIFDEIHKYSKWKLFLKGLYDVFPNKADILVTGSARLDVYQYGGDSLMGRYFPYHIHPLTVGELSTTALIPQELKPTPTPLQPDEFKALFKYGGFPEPYSKANDQYSRQWQRLRFHQLFREDLRDLTRVQELSQLETLAQLLKHQCGGLVSYASMARKIRVSDQTIRHWITTLSSLYYCFQVRPWTKNVARSLLKEPKYYLIDWSLCEDEGARAENMVACHLLKAVQFWTDHGLGEYHLYYLRDKNKREVDFLVSKNNKPFFIVEVKRGKSRTLSPSLLYYREQLNPQYVLQVAFDLPFDTHSCFEDDQPRIVSAHTFLSQLV